MSESVSGEVAAEYILKNRANGWLKYAVHVLEAAPYIRRTLLTELRQDVVGRLEARFSGTNRKNIEVESSEFDVWWFSITVSRKQWGDFQISLENWEHDGREVAISVFCEGAKQPAARTRERIRETLATLRYAWHRKKHADYIWNVWAEHSDWSTPELLLRLVDEEERQFVASQVEQDIAAVVNTMDETLMKLAKEGA